MWIIVGYLAAFCGTCQLIPEVVKASKTHHLQDISWGMLCLMIASSVLWFSYGVNIRDIPLIISSTANFAMEVVLIIMKRHYELTRKPFLKPALETETVETNPKAPAKGL